MLPCRVPREGYISVRNAEFHYREAGQGEKVILLHGGPISTIAIWDSAVFLVRGAQPGSHLIIYVVDRRQAHLHGHGLVDP